MKTTNNILTKIIGEPIIYFFIFGFMFYFYFKVDVIQNEKPSIIISKSVITDLTQGFVMEYERQPLPEETQDLIERYIEEEILFNEGLKLNFHFNDPIIRKRIVDKVHLMQQQANEEQEPTEEQLRRWYSEHKSLYRSPILLSFQLANTKESIDQQQAMALADALDLADARGENIDAHTYNQRYASALEVKFGAQFTNQLIASKGFTTWQPLISRTGWQIVKIISIQGEAKDNFARMRKQVLNDWKQADQKRLNKNAMETLKDNYRIEFLTL